MEADIPASPLVAASIRRAIVVVAICPQMSKMVLGIGVNGFNLDLYVLGGISIDSRKLFIRQQLITIWCQNQFPNFFLSFDEIIYLFMSHGHRPTYSETEQQ